MYVANNSSEYQYIISVESYLLYWLWNMGHIAKFIYMCACVTPGQKKSIVDR